MTDHSQLVKRLREHTQAFGTHYEQRQVDVCVEAADAIEALQARVAELEKLAQRITNEGRIASGGVRRPAKYIQIPADLFSIARALMERKPS